MIKKGKSKKKIISILLYRSQCAAFRATTVWFSFAAHLALWRFFHFRLHLCMVIYLTPKSHAKLCLSSFVFSIVVARRHRQWTSSNGQQRRQRRQKNLKQNFLPHQIFHFDLVLNISNVRTCACAYIAKYCRRYEFERKVIRFWYTLRSQGSWTMGFDSDSVNCPERT